MSSDDLIDLTVDSRSLFPQVIVDEWLPKEEESILFLFQQFQRYPPHPSHYILPPNLQPLLHQDEVQGFDFQLLLKIGPPALPSISKAYQDAIKKSKFSIHSVTLKPFPGDPITLPAWIFDYWREIGRAVDTRKRWKVALTWVSNHSTSPSATELCYKLLLGLSSFSWSYGATYTCDITPLLSDSCTESYLSSFHIDHTIGRIKTQYEEYHGPNTTNRHIFATVDHFNSIIRFYRNVHAKKEGSMWDNLMVIENKIVTGEVDSLGGVMHLPLHWVSIVINFQQQEILYGDSLGQQMPDHEYRAFERWIKHLINRSTKLPIHNKITLNQLPTGHQNDGTSCGLFALNAIAHHYLKHPLLSSNPIMLVCRRMEIALDIINSMTVCLFYMVQLSVTQYLLQTLSGDPKIPSDFSFLSPPIFVQPLPDLPPVSSPKQKPLSIPSPHQDSLSMPLPSIILHDFSTHTPADDPVTHSSIHQQSMDDDYDLSIDTDPSIHDHTNPSAHDHTDSSIHGYPDPSAYNHTNYSGSDISIHPPLSSNAQTELSSAVTSDSDLPPPKPVQQAGLLNFFSAIPADEAHAAWSKRKRDNRERDEEERAEIMQQEEEWREAKRQKRREQNRISQQNHRNKVKSHKQNEDKMKLPVSEIFTS